MLGHNENYICDMDGDQFCVYRHDFLCLSVDPAGFGDTEEEALADLEKTEANR